MDIFNLGSLLIIDSTSTLHPYHQICPATIHITH
jgi:hypothetical protein